MVALLGIVAGKASSNDAGDLGLFGSLLEDANGNRGGWPELQPIAIVATKSVFGERIQRTV